MNNFLRIAGLNATRKPMRTGLTAGMVVAAVALLIIAMSWLDGIWGGMMKDTADATGHVVILTEAYEERENMMPLYENIADVAPVLDAVRSTEGVQAAYPVISTGATVTVGEEIGDVFGLVTGAPAEYFTKWMGAEAKLADGRWWTDDSEGELVIGSTVAEQASAKVGDELVALGQTQDGSMSPIKGTIVGIVHGGSPTYDRKVFVPLATAQYMADMDGGAVSVLAFAEDYNDGASLAEAVRAQTPGEGLSIKSWVERPPWDQMMGTMMAIRGLVYFIVVFLAALGVWNTMMMSVLERTSEIGVLRAMGMTRLGAVLLFVGEAAAIGFIGSSVGVVAGVLPMLWMEKNPIVFGEDVTQNMGETFVIATEIYADLTPDIVVAGFVLGVVTAIVGSVLPAIHAASIQPVVAMRRK